MVSDVTGFAIMIFIVCHGKLTFVCPSRLVSFALYCSYGLMVPIE
jgi:hypothetical protein